MDLSIPAKSRYVSDQFCSDAGHCLDHLYVKESTIGQAGAGGFARRFLEKDSSVISAPLITVFGEDMFKFDAKRANESFVGTELNDQILFLNYHFGHPNSSVYFFPITHAFVINHNSGTMPGGQEPNARLSWATWSKKSNYFLQKPLADLEAV